MTVYSYCLVFLCIICIILSQCVVLTAVHMVCLYKDGDADVSVQVIYESTAAQW